MAILSYAGHPQDPGPASFSSSTARAEAIAKVTTALSALSDLLTCLTEEEMLNVYREARVKADLEQDDIEREG